MRWLRIFKATTGLLSLLAVVLTAQMSLAVFSSGSDGSDGAFSPSADVEVALPDDGVLQYTTVDIPAGVTVTFTKNASNTPVKILASGDVTIEGIINVSGKNSPSVVVPGEGGPGGYGGGKGGLQISYGVRGEGTGSGGGGGPRTDYHAFSGCGGGAGYAVAGGAGDTYSGVLAPGGVGGFAYGNARLLPLFGGSGGGGAGGTTGGVGGSGGGGGGVILIASDTTITVNGTILANGGNGIAGTAGLTGAGGSGSGGAIRLVANAITGEGTISAVGGAPVGGKNCTSGGGSVGRINLEANSLSRIAGTAPPYNSDDPPYYALEPPNMPTLAITSIGGESVTGVASGSRTSPDVILPSTVRNPADVVVTATNIPSGTQVTVNVIAETGNTVVSYSALLSGSESFSTATVSVDVPIGDVSTFAVTATYVMTASSGGGGVYAEGEKVERVKVSSTAGGGTVVSYITESGREVPARL